MSRSATDATRFTSTTPHAARPSPASNLGQAARPAPPRTPGPAGETPQQRVKRLREAANRARDAKLSSFDKVVVRGRVWADRAHRFVALSLIGLTGVAGVVTVYALGDMVIFNRRKLAQFQAEQKALHASSLQDAQKAFRHGTVTEEQQAILDKEANIRQVLQAKQQEAAKPGMFARSKAWLFSGLKKEEEGEDFGSSQRRLGYEATNEEDDVMGERESDVVRAIEDKRAALTNKAKAAFEKERVLEKTGGPLDRVGTTSAEPFAANGEPPKSGGWTSFMTRR